MSVATETMSKSARQRANKKARDEEAAAAAEAVAPSPAPVAKATAKAKAKAEPEPKASAKAKAKTEAAPVAEPKADAKAKAKGKAKAEPKAAAAPEPKAEPKAKGKAKAAPAVEAAPPKAESKAKAKPKKAKKEEEEPAPKKKEEPMGVVVMDDGLGADWEVSTGQTKKQQKRQEKIDDAKKQEEEEKKALKAAGAGGKAATNSVPGMQSAQSIVKDAKTGKAAFTVTAPVLGVSPAVIAAKEAAAALAAAKVAGVPVAAPVVDDGSVSGTVKIPSEKIGRVIGPKGSNIALIKEKTGVKSVDTAGDMVTLVGQPAAVALAEQAVKELIEKGYMSLAFDDFKEEGVAVPSTSIPNIIGGRGAIIQLIKKECQVEIDIPPVPKDAPVGKKVKVSIAGGDAGVKKATEIINSIALYSYHEVTHPGFSHAEMEVEEWRYRFLIGKGGSEMRHIQNNFKVKVNIPRDTSVSDKVVVVGEAADVERAVKYIEKVLYEVNNEPKGRDKPEKSEDTWGDEPAEEPWMNAYMYKRR